MNLVKIATIGLGVAVGLISGYAGYKEGTKLVQNVVDIAKDVKVAASK